MSGDVHQDLGRLLEIARWRQGSIVKSELIGKLGGKLPTETSCAVVVSQDCDLVRHQDTEWNVELVCGTWIGAPNRAYLFCRHARKLTLTCTDGVSHVELDIRHRVLLAKEELIDPFSIKQRCSPEEYSPGHAYLPETERILGPESVVLLAGWLGQRYTRPAFPDEFNARITSQAGRKIDKLTKDPISRHVSCVYLMLNESDVDLPPDENYKALFWFACKRDVFESDREALKDVNQFAKKYIEAMSGCPGIEVIEGEDGWEVRGEHQITLDDLRYFKRYIYDHISRGGKPGGELPVETPQ